jgi:peptidoglycan hydrolase CwlO-like protein
MNLVRRASVSSDRNRKALCLCGFVLAALAAGPVCLLGARAETPAPEAAKNQELISQKLGEIKSLQAEIARHQADLNAKQKEGKSLKNEIAIYEGRIRKNQLEVQETKAGIEKAELEMEEAQATIKADDRSIVENKANLKQFLQELYGYQQQSVLEILVRHDNLSDFFNEMNSIQAMQDKTMQMVGRLRQEKNDMAVKSAELEKAQEEYAVLIDMRLEQNESLQELKKEKDEILALTNGEESKYQALVAQNRKLLPSLQAELRNLQSLGSDIKFDDAISAARYIGGATGVRPALLLAILRVESGLGTNVGGGRYATDMNPSQRAAFEALAAELGYDPGAMPCSKRPKSYQGWGGAIGPAQMLPTTWIGIKGEVAQLVKKPVPDPWNLTDSIAGIAVKLSKVQGVTAGSRDAEYEAAGIYLACLNWRKFTFYPDKVMYYTDLYEKELN